MTEKLTYVVTGFRPSQSCLRVLDCSKVEEVKIDNSRWAKIVTNVIAKAFLEGRIPLKRLELHGSKIEGIKTAGKDVRGAASPALTVIDELEKKGVEVRYVEYDMSDPPKGVFSGGDVFCVASDTLNGDTGRDDHFLTMKAILDDAEYARTKPVMLSHSEGKSPFTLSYETTKYILERAENMGVKVYENFVDALPPHLDKTIDYIKRNEITLEKIKAARTDVQVSLEQEPQVNRETMKRAGSCILQKGIHDVAVLEKIAEAVFDTDKVEFKNVKILHAEAYKNAKGDLTAFRDESGKQHFNVYDAEYSFDLSVNDGEITIPVKMVHSFNRPAKREMRIKVNDRKNVDSGICYYTLPPEQYRPEEIPAELRGQNVTGFFAEKCKSEKPGLIAGGGGPNILLEFLVLGGLETGKMDGRAQIDRKYVSPKYILKTAKNIEMIEDAATRYIVENLK